MDTLHHNLWGRDKVTAFILTYLHHVLHSRAIRWAATVHKQTFPQKLGKWKRFSKHKLTSHPNKSINIQVQRHNGSRHCSGWVSLTSQCRSYTADWWSSWHFITSCLLLLFFFLFFCFSSQALVKSFMTRFRCFSVNNNKMWKTAWRLSGFTLTEGWHEARVKTDVDTLIITSFFFLLLSFWLSHIGRSF